MLEACQELDRTAIKRSPSIGPNVEGGLREEIWLRFSKKLLVDLKDIAVRADAIWGLGSGLPSIFVVHGD